MCRKNRSLPSKFFAQLFMIAVTATLIIWSNVWADDITQPYGQIVFASWDSQIMLLDMKSSRVSQLTNSGMNLWPRWSFDGKKIAFASIRGGHNSEIYVMDTDGRNQNRVTFTKNGEASDPHWGVGKILYFRTILKGVIQENSVDLVSGEIRVISSSGEVSGRTIKERLEQRKRIYQIFPSRDGKYQILYFGYEKRLDLLERVTGTRREIRAVNPGQPSWSKDSKRVAYVSGNVPELILTIFDVKENKYEGIKLPSGPDTGCGGELSWNASSTQIVFSCASPYGEKPDSWLYVLDMETQKSSKLIKGSSPDWR